jgi:hypothetical protein
MYPAFSFLFLTFTSITLSYAKVHHLFVGNLSPPAVIHALEFDDVALTLINVKNITADARHVAFDVSISIKS